MVKRKIVGKKISNFFLPVSLILKYRIRLKKNNIILLTPCLRNGVKFLEVEVFKLHDLMSAAENIPKKEEKKNVRLCPGTDRLLRILFR